MIQGHRGGSLELCCKEDISGRKGTRARGGNLKMKSKEVKPFYSARKSGCSRSMARLKTDVGGQAEIQKWNDDRPANSETWCPCCSEGTITDWIGY